VIVVGLALIAAAAIILLKQPAKKATPTPIIINTQSLDNGTLNRLTAQAGPNATKQQLTITPDTLFKNTVVVQGALKTASDLDVAGNLNVHGKTTLQGAVGINSNLAVHGALSVGRRAVGRQLKRRFVGRHDGQRQRQPQLWRTPSPERHDPRC